MPLSLIMFFYNSVEIESNLYKLIEMEIDPVHENADCVPWNAVDDPVDVEQFCQFVPICKFISAFLP